MTHLLRAEIDPSGKVRKWHVVRDDQPDVAMCGADVDEAAESMPAEQNWGRPDVRCCQQCGSLYLHEIWAGYKPRAQA